MTRSLLAERGTRKPSLTAQLHVKSIARHRAAERLSSAGLNRSQVIGNYLLACAIYPFNVRAWRSLALYALPQSSIDKIRKLKMSSVTYDKKE